MKKVQNVNSEENKSDVEIVECYMFEIAEKLKEKYKNDYINNVFATVLCPKCLQTTLNIIEKRNISVWPYISDEGYSFEDEETLHSEHEYNKCTSCNHENTLDPDELVILVDLCEKKIYIHEEFYKLLKEYDNENKFVDAIIEEIQ